MITMIIRWSLFIVLILNASRCSGQEKLDVVLVFDSKVRNDVVISLKKEDSLYFPNKYEWFAFKNLSLWCLDENGIRYKYDYDKSKLSPVNGIFPNDRTIHNPSDVSGKVEFNYFFNANSVGWLTLSDNLDIEVLRIVDLERDFYEETSFQIPKDLQDLQPIIISKNKLLYHNLVLNSDNTIDTLDVDIGVSYPHFDRVYMRRNSFMVDRYYAQKSPKPRKDVSPIDFFKIEGNRLIAQEVNPPGVKIENYRVETSNENIWLLSHKIDPEKFLLYDVNLVKGYPFELDTTVFRLDNLRLIEMEPDIENPYDVNFSYHTSMTEDNIYIYMIKDGIKIYKVSDYRKLFR